MVIQKDGEIKELKRRIDEISSEFADMLKDSLTKLQERIELTSHNQFDDEIDTHKKFEEFTQ